MKFKFDEDGHIVWSPKQLYQMVLENSLRLVNDYLMGGITPKAFDEYAQYCDFVQAVAERTGVHPRNLYLRGSRHIGFSIAPRADKVWTAMSDDSDLDLVIVDRPYFDLVPKLCLGRPALKLRFCPAPRPRLTANRQSHRTAERVRSMKSGLDKKRSFGVCVPKQEFGNEIKCTITT